MSALQQQHQAHRERMGRLFPPQPVRFAPKLVRAPEPPQLIARPLPVEPTDADLWEKAEVVCLRRFAPRVAQDQDGPRIKDIQDAVAKHYGVRVLDLCSRRRTLDIVLPRQVAMYLARMLTPHSSPAIAKHFGARDHTTCLYSVRKVEGLLPFDSNLREAVLAIEIQLSAGRV